MMVLTVSLVTLTSNTSPLKRLVIVKTREHTEDDGRASVELDAHEGLADGIADVLKVHRRALDEHADGDDGVEGLLAGVLVLRLARGRLAAVALDEGEEVGRRNERVGAAGLLLAALDEPGG